MTRTFPLVAVFVMLATLCLSTTSAIPLAKRDYATAKAECVQKNWNKVRDVLSTYKSIAKDKAPELFQGDEPIAAAPSFDKLEADLKKFYRDYPTEFKMFLGMVDCRA